jgi:hypothetical protein
MKATGIPFTAIGEILHKYLSKITHPQIAVSVNSLAISPVNPVNQLSNIPAFIYSRR